MFTAIAYNAKYMVEDAREQQAEISVGQLQKKKTKKIAVKYLVKKLFKKHTISHA